MMTGCVSRWTSRAASQGALLWRRAARAHAPLLSLDVWRLRLLRQPVAHARTTVSSPALASAVGVGISIGTGFGVGARMLRHPAAHAHTAASSRAAGFAPDGVQSRMLRQPAARALTTVSSTAPAVPRPRPWPYGPDVVQSRVLRHPAARALTTLSSPLPALSPEVVRSRTRPLATFLGREGLEPGEVVPLDQPQLESLLVETDDALVKALYTQADSVCERFHHGRIHFRGLVEFSNVCRKDCGYCGIRKRMANVKRYTMSKDEIVGIARWAHEQRYGSVMLQSGELLSQKRLDFLCDVIATIRSETTAMDEATGREPQRGGNRGLGVALSVGELPLTHYRALREAGAHRYLLRIESSNPQLYARLHPKDELHSWDTRYRCIKQLQELGFQLGTGVMIGLPTQTVADLARDLLWFKQEDIDMVGMGPYVYEAGTPVGEMWVEELRSRGIDKDTYKKQVFERTTRMIALARLTMGDVNIAATTALQAIRPDGREVALRRGANILMPILTPADTRKHYQLYEGKPCLDETATQCRGCLELRVRTAGKEIAWGEWGDPVHYLKKAGEQQRTS